MQSSLANPATETVSKNASVLMQYLFTGQVNSEFINAQYEEALKDQAEPSALFVVVYYLFLAEDYNRLFCLLHTSNNLEHLSIKTLAYVKINRLDLADQTLQHMKSLDEDSPLTSLAHSWLSLYKGCGSSALSDLSRFVTE